jgi:hypothetical protein
VKKDKMKKSKTTRKLVAQQAPVWALVWPDGTTHAAWMYESKADLMRDAPGQIYGDVSTWQRATNEGYRAKKFYLTTIKPEEPTAKTDKRTEKSLAPTDTEMLDYLQKHANAIERTGVRAWRFKGKKQSGVGDITLRRLIARVIKLRYT